jgi:hypothetical protein
MYSLLLRPVLRGVRDAARIHNPSCTDSIKPSLQFSCNFVVLMLTRDHFVSRFLIQYVNVSYILLLNDILQKRKITS